VLFRTALKPRPRGMTASTSATAPALPWGGQALAWWAGRDKPALSRGDLGIVVGLAFSGYYLASFLDFLGLQFIGASLERLILYLNPTLVLGLGAWLFGRRVTRWQLVALGVSYAGVLLEFGHETVAGVSGKGSGSGSGTWLGAALVFGCAVCHAVYLVLSGEHVRRLGTLRLTGWASGVACLLCIGQFLLLRPLAAAQVAPEVPWLSLLNATLCTVAPVLMVMMAIKRIGPTLAAQTGMIGPLTTLLMGVWLLGEPLLARAR
jgi:drug/metabolite transporter (DMT)-like permease